MPRGPVSPVDVSEIETHGQIHDRVLPADVASASQTGPARVESYDDGQGNTITVGTSLPTVDLMPFAAVLAGTIHGREIEELRVLVVAPQDLADACGGGDGVVACYYADDPANLWSGEMILPSQDPSLHHAIVHEYGHHMDNQLMNLGHMGLCDFSQDGSRRWFFARDAYDDLVNLSGCSGEVDYSRLLGELFAEDFVVLNGIDEWFSSSFPPPTSRMLRAMRGDIERPFEPVRRRYRSSLRKGLYEPWKFRFTTPVFLTVRLFGPRRADFDLRLRRSGGRRSLGISARPRAREQMRVLVPKGQYVLDVVAYSGRGRYRLVVDID